MNENVVMEFALPKAAGKKFDLLYRISLSKVLGGGQCLELQRYVPSNWTGVEGAWELLEGVSLSPQDLLEDEMLNLIKSVIWTCRGL
jgi:hypothetical protein